MGLPRLGVVPLVSGLIGRLFGLRDFSLLFGLTFLRRQLGGFLGPLMGGVVLDWSGGYAISRYATVAVGAVAAVLQWPMDDAPRRRPAATAPV
jgi:MFS family permease